MRWFGWFRRPVERRVELPAAFDRIRNRTVPSVHLTLELNLKETRERVACRKRVLQERLAEAIDVAKRYENPS